MPCRHAIYNSSTLQRVCVCMCERKREKREREREREPQLHWSSQSRPPSGHDMQCRHAIQAITSQAITSQAIRSQAITSQAMKSLIVQRTRPWNLARQVSAHNFQRECVCVECVKERKRELCLFVRQREMCVCGVCEREKERILFVCFLSVFCLFFLL